MKIGVIGGGVVGHATAECFRDGHTVEVFDLDPKKSTTRNILDVVTSDLVFVCLPTPQKEGSLECDTSYIDHFFAEMATDERERNANYVLRSTVPIGTTRRIRDQYGIENIVHSPEFLSERSAVEDAKNPMRMLIGKSGGRTNCALTLWKLYKQQWDGLVRVHLMTSDESEAVKLFQNGFSAVKISYLNEIYRLCENAGLDWGKCLSALLDIGWINPRHTLVPGPDGKFGWGGSCFPKDLANLITCLGDDAVVTKAAMARNKLDRSRPRGGEQT